MVLNTEETESQRKLRIGILLDDFLQPAWVGKVIETIQTSDFAKIERIVLNAGVKKSDPGLLHKAWNERGQLAYRAYSRLDNFLFRPKPDAFARINLETVLAGCPVLKVTPVQKKFSDYFPEDSIEAIRNLDLDVLLRFGFRILRGEVLRLARFGIWSYHHGDNDVNRGGPPGFWEVMTGEPVTGSVLQILSEDLDAGAVLYRSYSRTEKRSVKRNRNKYYWKSAEFVVRKLRDLYCDGPDALNADACGTAYKPYNHRLYKNPGNFEFIKTAGPFLLSNLSEKIQDLYKIKQWFLAYQFNTQSNKLAPSFFRFKELIPPKDRYWADPFPVKYGEKFYVFMEEYLYGPEKGHISVIELSSQGGANAPLRVLEKETHLSYPFIFQWRDSYYMIPEEGETKRVNLYRCTDFPGRWEYVSTLLEGVRAVDATLAEIDGQWWMFVTIGVDGAATVDELHVFHAQTPLGPWKPHRKNPVKSDCRSARPAGNLFRWNNALYRPAQDCSIRYGYAVSINKITRLDSNSYAETEISKIYPKWKKGLLATHTLNTIPGLTIIDAMRTRARYL